MYRNEMYGINIANDAIVEARITPDGILEENIFEWYEKKEYPERIYIYQLHTKYGIDTIKIINRNKIQYQNKKFKKVSLKEIEEINSILNPTERPFKCGAFRAKKIE